MGRYAASAVARAPPATAAARILSPAGLQAWWLGKMIVESIDADRPAIGSRMRWRAGGASFEAEVTESALPKRLVLAVRTPSATSFVTQTFEDSAEGGTRYEKIVDTEPTGVMGRLFDPLIGGFVKREVKRAVAFADAA